MHRVDAEHSAGAVELGIDSPDETLAVQDRQHEVAVLPFGLRNVDLHAVVEVEERLGSRAVVDQPVERREERRAAHGTVVGIAVCDPATAALLHAERTEPLLGEVGVCLVVRQRLGITVPTLRDVPQALAAVAADGRDLPARAEELEHSADVAISGPAARRPRHLGAVLELAREHRAVAIELAEHVPLERRVRLQPFPDASLPRRAPSGPALHPREQRRQCLLRIDERDPLVELAPGEEAHELVSIIGAEPAPEHQELRRGDAGGRVELQAPEPAHGLEHARRAPVERLGADCDAPGLGGRHLGHARARYRGPALTVPGTGPGPA